MKKSLYVLGVIGLLTAGFAVGRMATISSVNKITQTQTLGAAGVITGKRIERSATDIVRVSSIEILPDSGISIFKMFREIYDANGILMSRQFFEDNRKIDPLNIKVSNFLDIAFTVAQSLSLTNPATNLKEVIGGTIKN